MGLKEKDVLWADNFPELKDMIQEKIAEGWVKKDKMKVFMPGEFKEGTHCQFIERNTL